MTNESLQKENDLIAQAESKDFYQNMQMNMLNSDITGHVIRYIFTCYDLCQNCHYMAPDRFCLC